MMIRLVVSAVLTALCLPYQFVKAKSGGGSFNITAAKETAKERSPVLSGIYDRGVLRCAHTSRPGFAFPDEDGHIQGMDADLCDAVSAAIFGAADYETKTEHMLIPNDQRFTGLESGRFDLVVAATTYTMERNVFEDTSGARFEFSDPYLYDGQGFGGVPEFVTCIDQFLQGSGDLSGSCSNLKICVNTGTTTLDNLRKVIDESFIYLSEDSFYNDFIAGKCNVISSDASALLEPTVRETGYTGPYALGTERLSKEPLAIMMASGDPYWKDFVFWVFQSLLYGEENDITQATWNMFPEVPSFGKGFEVMGRQVLKAVGNYGELYNRTVGPYLARGGLDLLNVDTGRQYSYPFGGLANVGPAPVKGSKLHTILTRGQLRCGITRSLGFGEFSIDTLKYSGLDVAMCQAIGAALFDGSVDHILYIVLPSNQRFQALRDGYVDLLSRTTTWTLARDVLEPVSGVGLEFTPPTFYDGLAFGGDPAFVPCAEAQDTTGACSSLKVCVNEVSTTFDFLTQFLPQNAIYPTTDSLVGFAEGNCNVVAGDSSSLIEQNVRSFGYTGAYTLGTRRFTKEPLAIATSQGDQQFNAFTRWIVLATFYAEEQNITRTTAEAMPLTSLFGPLLTRILPNAIQAVGNYGEIYANNMERYIARGGQNLLNTGGPQHYALPI